MIRKIIVSLLSIAIISSVLIGCGKKTDDDVWIESAQVSESGTEIEEVIDTEPEETTEDPAADELTAGVYYQTLEDEMEGIVYKVTYYVELNDDGTGTWNAQDSVDVTWNDKEVKTEYADYEVSVNGNNVSFMSDGISYDFIKLEGKFVTPLKYEVDKENIPDGTYPADIGAVSIDENGVMSAYVDIYTEDWYDIVDISTLEKGDAILVNHTFYVVDTVEDGNGVIINGGLEEGGTDLISPEDSNGYRFFGFNDASSYTLQFNKRIEISEDAVLYDSYGDPQREDVYKYDEIISDFETDGYFYANSTTVRTEGGKIVEITRRFIP